MTNYISLSDVIWIALIVLLTVLVRNPWIFNALNDFGSHYNSSYIDQEGEGEGEEDTTDKKS